VDFIDRKDSKIEDTEIVDQGLSIWISCLASDPSILRYLFEDSGDQANDQAKFTHVLIEKGLVCAEHKIREALANTIRFIVTSIKSPHLSQSPLFFFLGLLISKLDQIQNSGFSRYTKHYFSLLKELLPTHLAIQKKRREIQVGQMGNEVLDT
jgi:hypothetical protein